MLHVVFLLVLEFVFSCSRARVFVSARDGLLERPERVFIINDCEAYVRHTHTHTCAALAVRLYFITQSVRRPYGRCVVLPTTIPRIRCMPMRHDAASTHGMHTIFCISCTHAATVVEYMYDEKGAQKERTTARLAFEWSACVRVIFVCLMLF